MAVPAPEASWWGVRKCVWRLTVCWLDRRGSGCAHADLSDLGIHRVIWRRSGCGRGEGPGAMLDAA
jgi:hypothetical protein